MESALIEIAKEIEKEEPSAEVQVVQQTKTAPKKNTKDFKPVYSSKKETELKEITSIVQAEIDRVKYDTNYHATSFGNNVIIPLHTLKKEGKVHLVKPLVNRSHGGDQKKTGESLLTNGAQHILLVITVLAASKAGLLPEKFENDKSTEEISDEDLMVLDGNGRIEFLHSIPDDKWPEIYAVFPTKDGAGCYNLTKAFNEINCQVSVWKTQDFVTKRIIDDGDNAHEGWDFIIKLVKKGYMYQAACELATLGKDRITKAGVTKGNADEIFLYFGFAKKIHEALVEVFGEGKDKTLQTKVFPMSVSTLWKKLRDRCGAKYATDTLIKFFKGIKSEDVNNILQAKSIKGGATKDETRKSILESKFKEYVQAQGVDI